MFCSSCGNQLKDGAKFCEYCGAAIGGGSNQNGTRFESPNPNGASGSPFSAQPSPFDAVAGFDTVSFREEQYEEARKRVGSDFLWLNFLSVFLCCLFPTTIAAVCFSIAARAAKGRYDWQSAGSRATVARTLFWINLALGILGYGFGTFAVMTAPPETDGLSVVEKVEEALNDEFGENVREAELDGSQNDKEQGTSANDSDEF